MNPKVLKPEEERWEDPYPVKKRSWRWLWSLILVVILYLFSYGPVNALTQRGTISRSTLSSIYKPLDAASDGVPLVGALLDWYAGLWVAESAGLKHPDR